MAWVLRERIASWNANDWTVSVDLNSSPRLSVLRSGVARSVSTIHPQDAQDSKGDAKLCVGEHYVRSEDLVAQYPEYAPFAFGYQTYFSLLTSDSKHLCLELWLSVQTSTLQAYPQLLLEIPSDASPLLEGVLEGLYHTDDHRVAWLIHPLDADDVQLVQPKTGPQQLVAFGGFMEKGVIRRLRARLIVSTHPLSELEIAQLHQAFAESPLPLTT